MSLQTQIDPIDLHRMKEEGARVLQMTKVESQVLFDSLDDSGDHEVIDDLTNELDLAQGNVQKAGDVEYIVLRIIHK